jgi:hypothetical protein
MNISFGERRISILDEVALRYRHWRFGFVKIEDFRRGRGYWWLALYRRGA